MLADQPIDVALLAPDLGASREFYAAKLGLEALSENESTIVLACGGDGRIILSASSFDSGDALHAWIVDPGNNTIGIDQRN